MWQKPNPAYYTEHPIHMVKHAGGSIMLRLTLDLLDALVT